MHDVIFHLFRKMRTPLIVLIVSYAVSVLGFVMVPGIDGNGEPWSMSFFYAFYVVSYTASTIGYGEIPYPFTEAQRFWASFSIYLTVISWLYAIGSMLTIVQSPAFQGVIEQSTFARRVRRINEPFYLICGYGDTGALLVNALSKRGVAMVVIDDKTEHIASLETADLVRSVPGICGNAADIEILVAAGLTSRHCVGVVAITDDENVNLLIAIASKLLNENLPVIGRAETDDMESNMKSFGTDYVVNPYNRFANRLAVALRAPSMFTLFDWLTHAEDVTIDDFKKLPRGNWIICGYGRFGKAVHRFFSYEGLHVNVVELDPASVGAPEGTIKGRGTEAVTLREAGIDKAVGIIAGTNNDANNLSIMMTARELNSKIFIIARQNDRKNSPMFSSFKPDLVMQPGSIVAQRVLSRIMTPLLAEFLRIARTRDEEWVGGVIGRIRGVIGTRQPYVWTITIDQEIAPAAVDVILDQLELKLVHLLRDPTEINAPLQCVPLFIQHLEDTSLDPADECSLKLGDSVLFCGTEDAERKMLAVIENNHLIRYCMTGREQPMGWLWRKLASSR